MTGYSPTHIPIPKNHADFERKATVLFREILKDPDAKRLVSVAAYFDGPLSKDFDGLPTSASRALQGVWEAEVGGAEPHPKADLMQNSSKKRSKDL